MKKLELGGGGASCVFFLALLTFQFPPFLRPSVAFSPASSVAVRSPGARKVPIALQGASSSSSSQKKSFDIVSLEGDGIGPEIMAVALNVLKIVEDNTSYKFNVKGARIGGDAIDNSDCGMPFPQETEDLCKQSDAVLLACIGGPKYDTLERARRPESGLLKLRKQLNLFANLRPAKSINSLLDCSTLKNEVVKDVDVMVVRELIGDVYFGEPKGTDTVNGERVAYNNMIYTESQILQIAKVACEVAKKRDGRICSVDKANVLDVSQLWRSVVTDHVNENHAEDISLSHMYVDNAAMQLILNPRQFDVILTGNIFGDILSDEASMLVGSLGMLPSASLSTEGKPGVFEPCHGSAPDIAGQDLANPIAMVLSTCMMLEYGLGLNEEAKLIEDAVMQVLDEGHKTKDLGGDLGCKAMGDIIQNKVKAAMEQRVQV